MTEFESDSDESEYSDSDAELQKAFVEGKLKPGLNKVIEKSTKVPTNNVSEMKQKLNDIKLNLPWIETLDLVNKEAPLAPEMAVQMQEQEDRRANQLKNNAKLKQFKPTDDPVLNDFKREMLFHRQAQSAVMEAIPRLKAMGIPTKRPDDYFAEMAKTDDHMHKVRQALMKRQAETQQREKVRQLRIHRKEGKVIQQQQRLQRQQEKKEVLDQVKKVRKGISKNLDFLDGKKGGGQDKKSTATNLKNKITEKRKQKNQKYGFGGRKKGSKRNTKESAVDFGDSRGKNWKNNKAGKSGVKRPGKNFRQKVKSKGKGKKK